MLEHLWAPWRSTYVVNAKRLAQGECLFCHLGKIDGAREHLLLYGSEAVLVVLNRFPYATGHVMVAPRGHFTTPLHAPRDVYHVFADTVVYAERVLRSVYRPDGINIGMNLGEAAGAGVPSHFHMHVVPRWGGDTNFMATVAGTRVHPESLQETMARLLPFFTKGMLPADDALFAEVPGGATP